MEDMTLNFCTADFLSVGEGRLGSIKILFPVLATFTSLYKLRIFRHAGTQEFKREPIAIFQTLCPLIPRKNVFLCGLLQCLKFLSYGHKD